MEYCQSCGRILNMDNTALAEDGTLSEYCTWCYENGHFTMLVTCEEMQDIVSESLEIKKIPKFVKKRIIVSIPNLRRWQNENTGD